ELVRYDSKSKRLIPFLGGISADHVHFSRDDQWVAYISFPERTLWRCRADGTAKLQLTFPPMTAYSPQWSPDGSRIPFTTAAAPGEPFKISLIGRDGGEVETPFSAQEIGAGPGWSPDGRTLGFSAHGAGDDSGSATTSIRVLDLKTGKANVVPGSDGLHFTGWSPDGRYLAAVTVEGHRLMLFSRGTTQCQQLTRQYVDYPHWS